MKRRNIVGITAFFLVLQLQAQIINTEALRMNGKENGWAGSLGLYYNFTKNTKEIITLRNNIHVQYKKNKHLILFINQVGLYRAGGDDFVNKATQHLRYNYAFHPGWTWEVYLQNQYNSVSKIDYRRLAGSGVRYEFHDSKKYKLAAGVSMMYETEKATAPEIPVARIWRNSNYLTFALYLNDKVSLQSTTYYQPQLNRFSDYRISHQTGFKAKIFKHLSFKTDFYYFYDAFPLPDIPRRQYTINNGLEWKF